MIVPSKSTESIKSIFGIMKEKYCRAKQRTGQQGVRENEKSKANER